MVIMVFLKFRNIKYILPLLGNNKVEVKYENWNN